MELTVCIREFKVAVECLLFRLLREHMVMCRWHIDYLQTLRGKALFEALDNFEYDTSRMFAPENVNPRIQELARAYMTAEPRRS